MQLRQYQSDIAAKACSLLQQYSIAYLAMQVRTGKTLTSLEAARLFGARSVLFLTKKKAVASIQGDCDKLNPGYELFVTNYEQIQNIEFEGFDLVICDEAHCLGQYPVMAGRTRSLKELCRGLPIIYLSGSPTPESYSQIYHQFAISTFSPFIDHKNFYAWVNAGFVDKRVRYVFNRQVNDYSQANKQKVDAACNHLFITYTQDEAGFLQAVQEHVIKIDMKETTYRLASKIKNKRVHIGRNGEEIIADTEVKLMQKLHQIYSGTVLCEDGTPICFDDYKADFINVHFKGQKIAIFYKFKAEYTLLQKTFGDRITLSPEVFNEMDDLIFCSQIQSGREGINLSTADAIVMFNIDFSSLSYQQAKARMQAKDRTKECLLYWIFAEGGIEEKIYERVINKQDYTVSYFRKDFKTKEICTN